ncbi:MAG: type III polyketide synthase [Planctomycetota bacterium]|jgi:alkylresorcinol/alkylpyrone synthase
MKIVAVGRALPGGYHSQLGIRQRLEEIWQDEPAVLARLPGLYEKVQVQGRHLAIPLETCGTLAGFGAANDEWIKHSLELGESAIRDALGQAGLEISDVDAIIFNSVTGIASPSIDARLVNRMGMRSDIKRTPIFGLGCVAGAAALSRAADYVRAFPEHVVLVLAVELCSLTLQVEDRSVANLISSGLFGDGAAAALVVGAERARFMGLAGPDVLATTSVFYPDTEEIMGWQISENGFRIQLSAAVPSLAREQLGADVDRFLSEQGRQRCDISRWVCHPGGPKVLQALQDALELDASDLSISWENLAAMGNLSSVSVLLVLADHMREQEVGESTEGLLLAMGPGFCSELLHLRWN